MVAKRDQILAYVLAWRFLHLVVHRYGSGPTGQALVALTLTMLGEMGYYQTVSELAELTGLPKSSVSRHVGAEMGRGFVEEFIDTADRRQRPTAAAKAEKAWHNSYIDEIINVKKEAGGADSFDVEILAGHMRALTQKRPPPVRR